MSCKQRNPFKKEFWKRCHQQFYSTQSNSKQRIGRNIVGQTYLIPTIRIERDDSALKLQQSLHEQFTMFPVSFKDSPIVLDLGNVSGSGNPHAEPFTSNKLDDYLTILKEFGIFPIGISHVTNPLTLKLALNRGIPRLLPTFWEQSNQAYFGDKQSNQAYLDPSKNEQPLILDSSISSGKQVYAQGKSLIVLGSVHKGAEVIADGDIHIYGTLQGRALAGRKGNSSAKVFAFQMEPELVSISDTFTTSEFLEENYDDVKKDIVMIMSCFFNDYVCSSSLMSLPLLLLLLEDPNKSNLLLAKVRPAMLQSKIEEKHCTRRTHLI